MIPAIAVFAYNRPCHLKKCLEFIEHSQVLLEKSLPLFIFCDAPKNEKDDAQVLKTQEIAKQAKNAHAIIRETNQGFKNIVNGIKEICDTYGEVIVIEDDVFISPDFLSYMCKSLNRYRENPKVFAISGHMYFASHPQEPELFFLPYFFCWGWATWKRAWDKYEWKPKGWETLLKNKKQRHLFDCYGTIPFSKMVEKTLKGKWNTWDAQWFFTIFKQNGLVLYPYRSLTWNSGCGGGVHGDAAKNENFNLGNKEFYIHGTQRLEDFLSPRLTDSFHFPKKEIIDNRAMYRLAVLFLKQKMLEERKKKKFHIRRLILPLKIIYYKLLAAE